MTLETFFEKFDLFADAPDAVAKMRELVLHLAVTGKLVAQDPSDEHADALIARIAEQRRAKKAKEYQPVTAGEAPYELPFSWSWIRLGNISLTSDSGWSPQCLPESRTGTEWGVLKVSAVSWGVFKPEENKALPPGMTSRPDCEVKAGDFLLSRANTEELVARSVVVDQTPPRLMMSDKIVRFTFPGEIERAFINLANSSVHSRAYYARNASGTSSSMKNIGREVMCNLPIALPPLAEQKRIVAKVDELMALCDRLEAQQQEREEQASKLARASLARFADAPTPANLSYLFHSSFIIHPSDLRKSILTLAVQGKLVPQDPNDEPAEKWLRTVAKSKPGEDRETVEPPFSLPAGWIWLHVASVFEVAGGIQKTPLRTPRNNAFPYLGVGNVYRGRLDLTNVKEFELEPGELERRRLQEGDLLIIEGNGSFNEIGRCAKWRGEIKDCVTQNHVIRCRPNDAKICDFVLLFLNSPNGIEIMQRLAITSSGLYSLSVGKIRQIEIPIPPLDEQRRIVAKVEQLMALVDALETQLAASRTTAANLLSALVAELTAA